MFATACNSEISAATETKHVNAASEKVVLHEIRITTSENTSNTQTKRKPNE